MAKAIRKSGAALLARWPDVAPQIAALLSFVAGAATLIAAANPGSHSRAVDLLSLIAIEAPGGLAAIIGVAQMAIADGLRRRVDGAAWGAAILSLLAAAYFLFHRAHFVDAALQTGFAAFVLLNRHAFYRQARAFRLKLSPLLLFGIVAVVLLAAIGATLWAATHPGFRMAPWWSLVIDPVIGRGGRIVLLSGALATGLVVWRYLSSPSAPKPLPPAPDDIRRAEEAFAVAESPRPEAVLAFSGDLSFAFSPSGKSFLAYAAAGSSLVALGGPVGRREESRTLIAAFCDAAADQGRKPVVYAAAVELLPDLLDLGFKVEKIGENAVINLETFSLSGKARENIRHATKKLTQREHATFEVREPPHATALIAQLAPISAAWLEFHKTGEKRFSLGRFDPDFLGLCPLGVARIDGKPVAFGSFLTTPDRSWAAVDLMRYDHASAPAGTMDFLLTEMILWAKEQGYKRFDLSMAPLSGLAEERHAPLFARLGRLIYEQGGRWYNFEGLRAFKEKFRPDWEPRYLGARGVFSLPVALAEIAMLTNSSAPERTKTRETASTAP